MIFRRWAALVLALSLLLSGSLRAQVTGDQYSDAELEQLVEPVALYPDALLTHVLTGATEPTQLRTALELSKAGQEPGSDLAPSVQALMEFPDVLAMMVDNTQWTDAVGYAVSNQQDDVLRAVQQVRSKVQAAGNLQSSDKMQVSQEGDVIVIESPSQDEVYVPSYDTAAMYATGALFTYGTAVAVRNAYWSGACDWRGGIYYGAPGAYRGYRYGSYPPGTAAWAPRPAPYAGRAATYPGRVNNVNVNRVNVNNYNANRVRPAGAANAYRPATAQPRPAGAANAYRPATAQPRPAGAANANRPATRPPAPQSGLTGGYSSGLNYTRGVDARQASSRGQRSMSTSPSMRGGGGMRGGRR